MVRGRVDLQIEADRFPQPAEHPVKLDAYIAIFLFDLARIGDHSLEERLDIGVAAVLASGKRPGKTPKVGYVRSDQLS
jgi:hypothetical protein